MFKLNPEIRRDLCGKELIAYGTGTVGKTVIPSLAQDPTIRLIGVTNSQIGSTDEEMFLETGLPLRSIQSWANTAPDASILMTAISRKATSEIFTACREAGFQEIIPIMSYIHDPIRASVPTHLLAGDPMLELIGLANEIHETHTASFSEFKACHRGRTVAVVATGPTLNYYSQIKGIPHIGVNTSYQREHIKLDYYFLNHHSSGVCEELKSYSFVKFFGHVTDEFPECDVEKNHARRFFLSVPGQRLHTNIEYYPMTGGFYSVIFNALQFALYTRPGRILLVGCDCTGAGHFNDNAHNIDFPVWRHGYRCLKEFAAMHYPDTEIVSLNPVGLKGMFRDVYTEGYLDAHPELDCAQCEILNPSDFEGK